MAEKTLMSFFKEIEKDYDNKIDQENGWVFHSIANGKEHDNLNKKVKGMCGTCFGGHLAEFFKTPLRRIGIDMMPYSNNSIKARRLMAQKRVNNIFAREFDHGALALFNKLVKCRHFSRWIDAKSKACEWSRSELLRHGNRITLLEDYLEYECGAPGSCFGKSSWKELFGHDYPTQVIAELIKLNPAAGRWKEVQEADA